MPPSLWLVVLVLLATAAIGTTRAANHAHDDARRRHRHRQSLVAPVATVNPLCNAAATITWSTLCTNLTARPDSCWTPARQPTSTDVVLFPVGSNATLFATWVNVTYPPLLAATIRIAAGANVTLLGDAFNVLSCLDVEGRLTLTSTVSYVQSPTGFSGSDPAIPEMTDCQKVDTGFTPRICGPGRFVVRNGGVFYSQGLFASIFLNGDVESGGSLVSTNQAFVWGNISNAGSYKQDGYMHGFLYNLATGVASFKLTYIDVWNTFFNPATPPVLLENWGLLTVDNSPMINTNAYYPSQQYPNVGVYRSVLVNYAVTIFNYTRPIQYGLPNGCGTEFDVINFNNVTYLGYNWGEMFTSYGTILNRATITANGMDVFIQTYHDVGGTMITLNGGQFYFGSGSGSGQTEAHYCKLLQDTPSMVDPHKAAATARSMRREGRARLHVAAQSVHQARLPEVFVMTQPKVVRDMDCWWYGGFCYAFPYAEDVAPREAKPLRKLPPHMPHHNRRVDSDVARTLEGLVKIADIIEADGMLTLETSCTLRYSLWNTMIRGDGTGSVVTTLPIEIQGRVRILAGGRWHAIAERRQAPIYGRGKIVVERAGTFVGGVDSDFRSGTNAIDVQRGGLFFIPRHATVQFSNSSLIVRKGGELRVDGKLFLPSPVGSHNPHAFVNCGLLFGVGRVVKERDADMSCRTSELV